MTSFRDGNVRELFVSRQLDSQSGRRLGLAVLVHRVQNVVAVVFRPGASINKLQLPRASVLTSGDGMSIPFQYHMTAGVGIPATQVVSMSGLPCWAAVFFFGEILICGVIFLAPLTLT